MNLDILRDNNKVLIRLIESNGKEHNYFTDIDALTEDIQPLLLNGFHLIIDDTGVYQFRELDLPNKTDISHEILNEIWNWFGDIIEME